MVKNVIFDMGNVLLEYDPHRAVELFCRTDEEKQLVMEHLFCGDVWVMGDRGEITNDERYEIVKKELPETMHPTLKRVVEHWPEHMTEIAGAKDFCRKCKERGYGIYVLSNACNRFYEYFPKHYDVNFFDGIMVSSSVKLIKPDTRIYELLCETYGLVPTECVFIDDRPENVDAARRVGMAGIVFTGSYETLALPADA